MKFKSYVVLLSLSPLLFGCSDGSYQTLTPLEMVDKGQLVLPNPSDDKKTDGTVGSTDIDLPMCEAPRTVYQLNAEVISLEIISRNSGSFGFDIAQGWFNFFKTKFKAVTGRLDLTMNVVDSINPKQIIAFGDGMSKMTNTEFTFDFGIKDYGISFEHFSKTPLAKLTSTALANGMSDLRAHLNKNSQPWASIVRAVDETSGARDVIIAAGTASNVKVGDKFDFYNIKHLWAGEPCNSKYWYGKRTSDKPLATGRVIEVANSAAAVRLDATTETGELVQLGAQAVVHKLSDPVRSLYQPLQIKNISGGSWKVEDETEVDFTLYLEKQVGSEASNYGFVIQTKATE